MDWRGRWSAWRKASKKNSAPAPGLSVTNADALECSTEVITMSKAQKPQSPPEPEQAIPQNIDAECMVLGYLLVGGPWREDVTAHDFAGKRHQIIFHAMKAIHDQGEEIDRNRLNLELGEKKLKHIGPGYLADLGEGCYPEMRIEPYVAKLHDAATQRDVLHHAHILMTHIRLGDRSADQLIEMGTAAFAGLERGQNHHEPPPAAPTWPDPIHEDGFHGIAGELVRLIEPHTEADPAALLVQFLVAWGSLVGRGPYYLAEEDRHHTNLFCVIAGVTSKGRKGTSWGRMRGVLDSVDEHWVENCLVSGLGSGEALIDTLNNEDRRRLVLEGEFARLLAIIAREGTTISSIFRQCWDMGEAHVTVRGKEAHVKGGHLSLIAHITKDELLRRLSDVEIANGFGNRILWVCAKRSKELPFGGGSIDFGKNLSRLAGATDFTRKMGNTRVRFDADASQLWERIYHDLSEGKPGLFGAVTGRAEAQVVRLSLLYAMLDCSKNVRAEHLRAALAVWLYCEDSARYIWGNLLGDPSADDILQAIRASANGLTRLEVYNLFSGHKKAAEMDRATAVLIERGLIRTQKEESNGRPTLRYLRA
jgi:Protein of unknown function (DUF3987)/DnaB-like helicase N terminal domain